MLRVQKGKSQQFYRTVRWELKAADLKIVLEFKGGYFMRILVGIAFYLAGFCLTALMAELSDRDIVVAMFASVICGLTMLAVTYGPDFTHAFRKRKLSSEA